MHLVNNGTSVYTYGRTSTAAVVTNTKINILVSTAVPYSCMRCTMVDLERPSRALQLHVTIFCTSVPYIQTLYAVCMLNSVSLYASLY